MAKPAHSLRKVFMLSGSGGKVVDSVVLWVINARMKVPKAEALGDLLLFVEDDGDGIDHCAGVFERSDRVALHRALQGD